MDECTLDIDSSVFTRYGKQEGAQKGYNPRKPGRPSHHPLLAFVADVNMVIFGCEAGMHIVQTIL